MSAEEDLLRAIFEASPAERLQAAIDKLERLRAEATPSPWHGSGRYIGHREADGKSIRYHLRASESDADLIVTLHRTIDAQLAILRFGTIRQGAVDWTNRLAKREGDRQFEAAELELALADAILGSES